MARVRRIPQRMCVGCGEMKGKKELIRVVRSPEGEVSIDPTGKKSGRGAYVCRSSECLEKAIKGHKLEKVLNVTIAEEVLAGLRQEMAQASAAQASAKPGPPKNRGSGKE